MRGSWERLTKQQDGVECLHFGPGLNQFTFVFKIFSTEKIVRIVTKILQTALRRGLVLAQSLQHLRSPFFPFLFVCPLEYLHAEYALQTEAPHSLSLSRGDEDVWNPRSTKFWAYLPPLVPFISSVRSSL